MRVWSVHHLARRVAAMVVVVACTAAAVAAPGAVSAEDPPAGGRLEDGFDRADAGSLGVAPTGQTWVDLAGGWDVASGLAAPEPGYSLTVAHRGGSNGLASVTLVEPGSEFWLVVRASDGANYWRFGRWQSGPYQLQQVAGNALGSPAVTTLATVNPAAGDEIACQLTATVLGCSVNGVDVVSTADQFNGSASGFGLASWSPSEASPVRFDELVVADPASGPDIAVSLTDVDPVPVGGQVHWTATVINVGVGSVGAVSLVAAVPAGVTAATATATSGSCAVTSSVSCALAGLAPGATAVVDIAGTAPASAGPVVLTVQVSAQGDVVPGNDTDSEATSVHAPPPAGVRVLDRFDRPDASTLGSAETGQPWTLAHGSFGVAGGRASPSAGGFDLALVDGGGTNGLASVTLVEPGSEFWLVVRASDGANYWRFGRWQSGPYQLQQVAGNALGSPAVTTLATVNPAAGDEIACQLTATVLGCSVNGVDVVSTADQFNGSASGFGLASWSPSEASPVRFDELVVADPASGPDIAVSLTDVDPVPVGGQVHWTATVINVGVGSVGAVSLVAAVPAGVTAATATATSGSCAVTSSVSCALAGLAPGATAVVDIAGTAPASAGPVVLTVQVSAQGDVVPGNDTDSEATSVHAPPPAGVRVLDRFDRPDASTLGSAETGQPWTLAHGSFGVAGGRASPSAGGFDLALVDGGGTNGLASVTLVEPGSEFWLVVRASDGANYWRFGRWQSGPYQLQQVAGNALGSPAVTTLATVNPAAGDEIACRYNADVIECAVNGIAVTNATGASLSARSVGVSSWIPGGTSLRFDDLSVLELTGVIDVAVAVTDDDPVFTGGQLRWRTTVSSVGTTTASGATLDLSVPSSATGVAATTDRGTCAVTAAVACALGDLGPGEVAQVVVTATAPSVSEELTATAEVSASGDANAGNDAHSETTAVYDPPAPVEDEFNRTAGELGVTETGEPWTAHAGAFATFGGEAGATNAQLGLASVDAGFAFGTFELTVSDVGDQRFWAVFRVVDAQNYYRVGPNTTGHYVLEKVVDGVPQGAQIQIQRTQIVAADGDVIRIVNRPDDGFFVSVNGQHLLDGGDVSSMNESRFGFATASTSVRFDRVYVGQVMTVVVDVTDSFNRPDAVELGSPETGVHYPWVGNYSLLGAQAFYAGTQHRVATVDSSSEATDVSVRVAQISDTFTLVFRYSESGSYFRFGRLQAGGGYDVDFVVGDTSSPPPVPVEVLATPVPSNGDVLEVRQHLDGRIEALVNGVVVLRFMDLGTNRRSTYNGLSTFGSTARFDDFRVVPE